jgi:sialate O-acetylesterase
MIRTSRNQFVLCCLLAATLITCGGKDPVVDADDKPDITIPYNPSHLEMPAMFSNNMVLQQQSEPLFWGKTLPGRKVTVKTSWNGKSYNTTAESNGKWSLRITTPAAGGPYTVSISDEGAPLELKNVMIGEVWLCSGQSNIEMVMGDSRNLNAEEFLASADKPDIRFFNVYRAYSLTPKDDVVESDGVHTNPYYRKWVPSDKRSARYFSAVSYIFARIIHQKLNVPVGVIYSAHGASFIESWMTPRSLQEIPGKTIPSTEAGITHQTPTSLYNGMIHPVEGFGIRGLIWYQGEANVIDNAPDVYIKMFDNMVREYRTLWNVGDFPVYYCQIAPCGRGNINSAYFREAQVKCMDVTPNVGMVSLLDVGAENDIHPGQKRPVGERLAAIAMAGTYGASGEYTGPALNNMKIEGNKAILTFDHATQGLTSNGKPLTLFKIAGDNRTFYQATATISGNTITLTAPQVPVPVAARYAFENWVKGELFNTEGFPASSFRTDTW